MIYSAVVLALIGAAAGSALRWKVLLPVIVLLPFAAIIFAASRDLKDALITILVAEAVLQGGYFVGLLIRFMVTAGIRSVLCSCFFKRRRARKTHDNDRRTAPR
jgi:hypothetical protein